MGPKAKTSAPSKKAVEKKKEKVIEVNISPTYLLNVSHNKVDKKS